MTRPTRALLYATIGLLLALPAAWLWRRMGQPKVFLDSGWR